MLNFKYENPVSIIFGKNQIKRLEKLVPKAKILLLYGGGSIKKNGIYEQVKDALGDVEVVEFGGVESNPTYETCLKAIELIKQEKCEFLLAVGGGSVIDAAKFIVSGVFYDGNLDEILLTGGKNIKKAMDFGCVLTLAATGSEANCGAVITHKALNAKLVFKSKFVYPKFSILDPDTLISLPKEQLANGIIDAFVHITEQYLTSYNDGLVADELSEGLLRFLTQNAEQILANNDYNIRANFMWSATLALNGLISVGVKQDWATHMIAHELTNAFSIAHGRTLALVLPYLLNITKAQKKQKLIRYAKNVWGLKGEDENELVQNAITKTKEFFESLGVSTSLKDYDLDQSDIEKILINLEKHSMTNLGEDQNIDIKLSKQILTNSLKGEIKA